MLTRDYLTVKVWDLNMEARPIETYQVGAATWKTWEPFCGWETPSPSLCFCMEGLSQLSGFHQPILQVKTLRLKKSGSSSHIAQPRGKLSLASQGAEDPLLTGSCSEAGL